MTEHEEANVMELPNVPVTYANELTDDISLKPNDIFITVTEKQDEKSLYKQLSNRLLELEKSLELDYKELNAIQQSTNNFMIEMEYKDSILTRIDWLYNLYEAWEKINNIATLQQAEQIKKSIAVVQTCPLKNKLKQKLETMINSMQTTEYSQEEALMNLAIDQAGEEFINLNSAAREFIITELVRNYHDEDIIQKVQKYTTFLNQQSIELKQLQNEEEFKERLQQLPLEDYHSIPAARINFIVPELMTKKAWDGLATLDYLIIQMNRVLKKQELDKKKQEKEKLLQKGKLSTLDYELAQEQSILSSE